MVFAVRIGSLILGGGGSGSGSGARHEPDAAAQVNGLHFRQQPPPKDGAMDLEKSDLRHKASSSDDNLYYDSGSVIIYALGSRYNSYCANVARTILSKSKSFQVLRKVHESAISAIKPGITASDVYKTTLSMVEKEE
ncbi:FACT complex subunit SPT16-like protein, partial [Tanacetum coccineum]